MSRIYELLFKYLNAQEKADPKYWDKDIAAIAVEAKNAVPELQKAYLYDIEFWAFKIKMDKVEIYDIKEIQGAAYITGASTQAIYRTMVSKKKNPLWCGYYAVSQTFACNPGYTDADSCQYADKMIDERSKLN